MKRKIDFQKLVNIYPYYDLSVRFDVFQWMMATGWEYRDRAGMFEVLYGSSGHGNQYYHQDFASRKDAHLFISPILRNRSKAVFETITFVRAIVAMTALMICDKHGAKAERI